MNYIDVKPAEGRLVIMPPRLGAARGEAMPAEGATVEHTAFVARRLKDGDLVEVKSNAPAEPQAAAKPSAAPAPVPLVAAPSAPASSSAAKEG